jgi:uncharacterized membrane protein
MAIGPIQMLVLGFTGAEFKGEILAELDRLREHDIVRLVDVALVRKNDDGSIERLRHSDLTGDELAEMGAYVGALIGLGAAGEEGAVAGAEAGAAAFSERAEQADDEVWYADDAIPPGTAAAVALLEHRWAIPLREAILNTGGFHLADAWIHPADLVGIGLLAAAEAEQELAGPRAGG